jgi:hypothetical protein
MPISENANSVASGLVHAGPTFKEAPHHLKNSFIEHVRATSRPEEFWALSAGRLSKFEPYEIITKTKVSRSQRADGTRMPCSICRPNQGKFLDGRLIFAKLCKRLFLIGHNCASDRTNRKANAEFERRRKIDEAREFLKGALESVPSTIQKLKNMRPAAIGADKRVGNFRLNAAPLFRVLQDMHKRHGDHLVVAAHMDERNSMSNKLTPGQFRVVGSVNGGRTVFLQKPDCEKQVGNIIALIQPLDFGERSSNEFAQMSQEQLLEAVKLIRRADVLMKKIDHRLLDVQNFFRPRSLGDLKLWGEHPLNFHPTKVRVSGEGIEFTDMHGSNVTFRNWPALDSYK